MDPGWASQPVTCGRLFKSAAWRDARWIHPRVFRSATLGPRRARARAAACIAMQRSQHKTSCHTWGDRQPTPGYSRTSARFEHSDRDEEKGGRPGGRAERERERTWRRVLAGAERGIEGRREREKEKVEVEERVDQGGIEDRRGGKEGGGGGERNPESWCSGVLSTGTRALRGRVRETGPLEISPDSNRARENHVSPPATRFSLDTNVKREEEEEEEEGKL